jgi:hypothetical protein
MTTRTLARRLERLQPRFLPPADSVQHVFVFVDGNGAKSGTLVLHPDGTRTWTEFEDPSGQRTRTESWTGDAQRVAGGGRRFE